MYLACLTQSLKDEFCLVHAEKQFVFAKEGRMFCELPSSEHAVLACLRDACPNMAPSFEVVR